MNQSRPGEIPSDRDRADYETKRVLQQEMMSRRFLASAPRWPRLQSGVLLVFIGILLMLVLQQVMTFHPASQIAHQQHGASATGTIGKHISPVWEGNDP